MSVVHSRYYVRRIALSITLVILFGVLSSLGAQDATPTDAPPTEVPTLAPTDVPPTEVPTLAPTDVPPTAMPTLAPTDVLPTAVPTDAPTQDTTVPATAVPTIEVMPSPTLVSEPPVFNFANGK